MEWRRLDLRSNHNRPQPDTLVALRMVPTNCASTYSWYRNERHDIGQFHAEDSQRKLWFRGSRGISDPVKMRKHFDIWWCYVPAFDGI